MRHDPRVAEACRRYCPNIRQPSHPYGRSAHDAVNTARSALARSHEATPEEIVFIGSGSEVGTLANRGAALPRRDSGDHIIT